MQHPSQIIAPEYEALLPSMLVLAWLVRCE